uniref:Uncharacterized protein n=1 Tax=Octopus bimaculoides TaxID=37653 RepID=A0A0L8HDC6_OCTBM
MNGNRTDRRPHLVCCYHNVSADVLSSFHQNGGISNPTLYLTNGVLCSHS